MIPMCMAQIQRVGNGYVVKFHSPVERERVTPDPMPPGFFEMQAEISLAMRPTDDVPVGAEDWNREAREAQEQRVRDAVALARRRIATRKEKAWVLEPQEYFAPSLADVMALLQQADAAQAKALALLQTGVAIHGLVPGSMIVPA